MFISAVLFWALLLGQTVQGGNSTAGGATLVGGGTGAAPGGPTLTTSSFPAGTVGISYSQTATASGGTLPYTWSVTGGSLPTGLSLAASTGVISGTPTVANAFSFTLRVTDNNSLFDSKALSIAIDAAPPSYLLSDDFETDLSKWDFNKPSNPGVISTTQAHGGTHSVKFHYALAAGPPAASTDSFIAKYFADGLTHYYVRAWFYVHVNAGGTGNGTGRKLSYDKYITDGTEEVPVGFGVLFSGNIPDTTFTASKTAGTGACVPSSFSDATMSRTLSSVATGTGVYTGTITGGASNAFVGLPFRVSGFTNAANNGVFVATASTTTTLTLDNASSVAETHSATAAAAFKFDTWTKIVYEVQLNTPSSGPDYDGVLRLWVNDVLIYEKAGAPSADTMRNIRGTCSTGINSVGLGHQATQTDPSQEGAIDEDRYWDDVVISTTYLGP